MSPGVPEILFLPGAGGSADFWRPVADLMRVNGVFLAWPGLGDEPADPAVNGFDDLTALVLERARGPVDIVAQSMGGLVALKFALAAPHLVNRLVLAVTSGGVPVADLGAADWRPAYRAAYPRAASWVLAPAEDLSERIATIAAPTLLLWGDRDPLSPVAVGERLQRLLPNARLCVVPGGGHDLARTHAEAIAPEIARHVTSMASHEPVRDHFPGATRLCEAWPHGAAS